MKEYILLIPILVSFFITFYLMPYWIKKARNAGLVGKDMNKPTKEYVAECGGVIVVISFVLSALLYIAIKTFYFKDSSFIIEIFALLFSILFVAFVGIIDDILGWKIGLNKRTRIILIAFASLPIIVINAGIKEVSLPFFGVVELSYLYLFFVIPIAFIGTSTTFNFLAGYNGLEARQGILIFLALSIFTYLTGTRWLSLISLCMVAALFAFLKYNQFPAKVFPGNTLTYALGALIALIAILGNIEKFAIFIFIPNIIEVFLKLRGGLKKESFAKPNKDGSLELKYKKIYGLEHFAIYILKKFKQKVYENDVVDFINIIQLIFILIAFFACRGGF